jgi:hypothetical protein
MVHILVTGIRDPAHPDVTPVYPRLEWSTFYKDKLFLTLYVKALEKFKAMSTTDTMSFYQIAGYSRQHWLLTSRYPWSPFARLG